MTNHLAFDLELYYKDYKNLAEQDMNSIYSWDNDQGKLDDVIMQGDGYSYGSDILLRTDWRGVSGFLGYTFGITQRKMQEANSNPDTGEPQYYYPNYDRAHQITLMQNFNLAKAFNYYIGNGEPVIGFNLTYKTGQPIDYPEKLYFDGEHFEFLYSYNDAERLPDYFRIDLSLRCNFINSWGEIEPYLEIINLTARENVESRFYDVEIDDDGNISLIHEDETGLPMLPTLGITVKW